MNYSEFNDEDFQYNEREDFHHNLDETINIIEIWLQNESPKNFDTSKSKEIIKEKIKNKLTKNRLYKIDLDRITSQFNKYIHIANLKAIYLDVLCNSLVDEINRLLKKSGNVKAIFKNQMKLNEISKKISYLINYQPQEIGIYCSGYMKEKKEIIKDFNF